MLKAARSGTSAVLQRRRSWRGSFYRAKQPSTAFRFRSVAATVRVQHHTFRTMASGGAGAAGASVVAPSEHTVDDILPGDDAGRRELWPEIAEPNRHGMMDVGDGHMVYWEESGNPEGKPAIFVHGGPGGGTNPKYRRFWNPEKYRIVLFDQRGSGKSTPHASLEANTTWHLVADMERIREHLGIEKWQVFGGSWGSTLALAYAETHPDRTTELVLRGIFMLRRKELEWFYEEKNGASFLYPDAWEHYVAAIPEEERGDMMGAYNKRLTSDDPEVRLAAARSWSIWEGMTSKLKPDAGFIDKYAGDEFAVAFARIENHYFCNGGFFKPESQLLDNVDKIRHIPCVIVQGRYDVVCPMVTSWELHRKWPEAEYILVTGAGHNTHEPGIQHHLLEATSKFEDK